MNYKVVTPRGWVALFVRRVRDGRYHFAFWYPLPKWMYQPDPLEELRQRGLEELRQRGLLRPERP